MTIYSGDYIIGEKRISRYFEDYGTQSLRGHWYLETWISIIMAPARVGLHGDYVVNTGQSPLGLWTHPVVIFPLAGRVLGEFNRKLMKLYPPTPAKIVNQKQYRIKWGGMVKICPPLRILRIQGWRFLSYLYLIHQYGQILENDCRLLNLQPSSSDHWFVKCILFYLVQERGWERVHIHME